MLLRERLAKLGALFFKYRSYSAVLFALVVLVFLASKRFHYRNRLDTDIYEFFCLGVSLLGLAFRVVAVGYSRGRTSGRNKRGQCADSLNTDGLYSVMRNPLYVGNFFIVLGITLLFPRLEVIGLNVLLFVLFYVPIILREEEFLLGKFGQEYAEYRRRTWAVIPNFRLWKKPQLKFNFLRVLYRENGTFMGIILGFVSIETLSDAFAPKKFRLHIDWGWIAVLAVGLGRWMASRLMKKRLKALDTAP
jgi:protein-S-isoprenylcysteine O-methyltransferase Ste14